MSEAERERHACCTAWSRLSTEASGVGSALYLGPSCSSANRRLHARSAGLGSACRPWRLGRAAQCRPRINCTKQAAASTHLIWLITSASATDALTAYSPARNAGVMNRHCSALLT